MAAKESASGTIPYTPDGVMDRIYLGLEFLEDRFGISVTFTFFLWTILISSLFTALVSYVLLLLTRSGLDHFVFSAKFCKVLWNGVRGRGFVGSPRAVVSYVKKEAEADNPDMALLAADRYAIDNPLMHIGDTKGKILDGIVADVNPTIVVELGAYFGYSAVRIARLLKKKGAKLISIEFNPSNADASRDFVKFAGLSGIVDIVTGSAADKIPQLRDMCGIDHVDMVLVDHWKDLYFADLKRMEETGLMRKGTVVVADNILFPGAPEYAKYVRTSPKYKCTCYPARMAELHDAYVDAMEVSIYQGSK